MDPVEALRELGGVAPFGELIALTSRPQILAALKAGDIHKPRHNRYCLADADATQRAVARSGGTASHLTAAQEFGWKLKHDPLKPCITMPRSARKPKGVLRAPLGRPLRPRGPAPRDLADAHGDRLCSCLRP